VSTTGTTVVAQRRVRLVAGELGSPDGRIPAWAYSWGTAAVFAVLYTVLSVRRHQLQQTAGYDLGIFEQAVRGYARLQAPVAPLKGLGFNVLGDHFSPAVAVLAPFYRIFPSPVTLLVAQSVLLSLAIVPLADWALTARGPRTALVVGFGLGASWGAVQAAAFDFHEVALAVPLIAYAVRALGEERWRAAALWSLPLLLVKEDQGLTLAAVGVYIALRGPRRLGLWLTAAGALGTCVEVLLILPAVNVHGGFDYWQQITGGGSATTGGVTQVGGGGSLIGLLVHLPWPAVKWLTVLMLLAPTGFLGLRSPLTLLCVPTLLWRFASGNSHYWGVAYHYSAVLMPIVFGGFVHALSRGGLSWRRGRAVLAASAAFTAATLPFFPMRELVLPPQWITPAHVETADAILGEIPNGVKVAASNRLAAQLVHRDTVTLVCMRAASADAAWVVVDAKDSKAIAPCSADTAVAELAHFESRGYTLVAQSDGITLLRR
jgi:uncharacterized membrane protein